jgi:predicted dinucleotide-binding enzyme
VKIGIIGAGNVGGTLGAQWARQGHEVLYGVRHLDGEKTRAALAASGPNALAGTQEEAAAFGEVVVIAVPYGALAETLPMLGDLSGKVVVDTVNNPRAAAGAPTVASEIAELLPGARVVKAFNTIGFNIMADPQFGDLQADSYICGDDNTAKATVADLSRQIGFDVVDAGPLANAVLLEALARLWMSLAMRQGLGRDIAFKLLRR